MKVYVNDSEIHLAPGMTVRHAIIGAGLLEEINAGKKVLDEWGNEVGLDGASLKITGYMWKDKRDDRHFLAGIYPAVCSF